MIDELFFLSGALNIGDSIPWLEFFDLLGYIKMMEVLSKKFDRFLEHVLDVLLQLAEDPDLEVKVERHSVKAFTQDLIASRTESSAVTGVGHAKLLKNPETLREATRELYKVIGNSRWVEEDDIGNLPYIYAIVKQTMRLQPV